MKLCLASGLAATIVIGSGCLVTVGSTETRPDATALLDGGAELLDAALDAGAQLLDGGADAGADPTDAGGENDGGDAAELTCAQKAGVVDVILADGGGYRGAAAVWNGTQLALAWQGNSDYVAQRSDLVFGLVDSAGGLLQAPRILLRTGLASIPAIAAGRSNYGVVYRDDIFAETRFLLVGPTGDVISGPLSLGPNGFPVHYSRIAYNALDDEFVVAFSDPADTATIGLRLARLSSSGSLLSTSQVSLSQRHTAPSYLGGSPLVWVGDRFVIIYLEENGDIVFAEVSRLGSVVARHILIPSSGHANLLHSVGVNGQEIMLALEEPALSQGMTLKYQRVSLSGDFLDALPREIPYGNGPSDSIGYSSVAGDRTGWWVVWVQRGTAFDGYEGQVWRARLAPDGTVLWAEAISCDRAFNFWPVIYGAEGHFFVTNYDAKQQLLVFQ